MEEIQEFSAAKREKGPPSRSPSSICSILSQNKKIILGPVSNEHPRESINTGAHTHTRTHTLRVLSVCTCVLIPASICVHRRCRHVCTSFATPPGPISIRRLCESVRSMLRGARRPGCSLLLATLQPQAQTTCPTDALHSSHDRMNGRQFHLTPS